MNTLENTKRASIMQRAHQIAKVVKRYQQPTAKYSVLLAAAMRQAYAEWTMAVKRGAIRLRLVNVFGYTVAKADAKVATMSDYQVNLAYASTEHAHSVWGCA